MNKLTLAARLLLGLIFFVFGLNGFFGFLPQPEMNAAAGSLMGAFAQTGYMFPMIKGIEVLAGIALLSGFFVPLALILLSPIVVNIALFHVVLAQNGYPMVIGLVILMVYLGWAYRAKFGPMLRAK
jgi:uncharacterized membrane protein YphA (DoxX/SURF4 family)